ncbi:MAG: diguanylate cyclase [Vallitaleaceae bacterium]|nr:diguanylate cyclase [Vallitaleaceae bacterium]
MNEFVLHRDLHVDPLTRLKNFIQFIEEDYTTLFGTSGIICIFDITNLNELNRDLGRETGDLIIRTAARVLCQFFPREIVYRTEGDAFTIIIKDSNEAFIEDVMDEAKNYYRQEMRENGYHDITLHSILYAYEEPITSLEDYYMFVVKEDKKVDSSLKYSGEGMVRNILGGVINRFRQSLDYYEEVYNYALIDEISGLPNAKAANQYLANRVTRTGRKTDQYCVLFIDGDDLRYYNDVSYQAGNQMIKKLGTIINEAIRDEDKVFRWLSGDEFIVILENTDHVIGETLAERIRARIESQQEDFLFETTVSIGVASYPIDGRDVDQIIYYAEKATKIAKEQGKNQVVSWREVDVAAI